MRPTLPLRLVAGLGLAAAPALAQVDVAIVAAASSSLSNCRYTDVQSKLLATGRFGAVDVLDAVNQTPSLATLSMYDAVLTWSNTDYFDTVALGDTLADYVDQGGGVVVAVFATSTTTDDRFLEGRWATGGYEIIQTQSGNTSSSASLGTIHQPGHPLVAGVGSLTASSAFRPTTTSLVQGTVVAEWSDGKILVAEGDMPGRVDLGVYPPSSDCSSSFWNATTDGGVLIANALEHVAGGGTLGTNYCMANANSTGVPAVMSATGSANVASNDFHLVCSDMPLQSFGYFLNSRSQDLVMNPGGSQGNLCLGNPVGRFAQQVQNSGSAGEITIQADLTSFPTPTGTVAVMAGETWNFSCWFRDSDGMGNATSNFADGLEVDFL